MNIILMENIEKLGQIQLGDDESSNPVDGYSVDLSASAMEAKQAYEKARHLALATPAVREDKVREFRERIKGGNYAVDSGKVADGILREAVKDHLSASSI